MSGVPPLLFCNVKGDISKTKRTYLSHLLDTGGYFPLLLSAKESACNAGATRGVSFLGQEDTLEGARQPTPAYLPGESHGQRSLAGCRPWGRKESELTGLK